MSNFLSGRDYSTFAELVNGEWQSYSGLVFEDLARTLLEKHFCREYEMTGGWWNRRGDEIDFIAFGRSKVPIAIEVKNREMKADDALLILKNLDNKIHLIPGFFDMAGNKESNDFSDKENKQDVKTGILAKGMNDADRAVLKDKGYLFYDIFDMIECCVNQ